MQTVTTQTSDAIKNSAAVQSAVQLIVEWNQNRYAPITSITNTYADTDKLIFPIESIADPMRPTSPGLYVARATDSTRLGVLGGEGLTDDGYRDTASGPRYILGDPESKYKYWASPFPSTGLGLTPAAIVNARPQILYTTSPWTNKVVVQFENTISQPTAWTIEITTDGTNWTAIATNPTISASGRVELYRQANNSWGTTVYRENPMQIRGIRINVTQMSKGGVVLELIELSPRLESDLSPFVESWGWDAEMAETSFIAPLGASSANTGNIKLSNIDARFTNDNASSLYYGLMDKYAEVRLSVGISTDPYTTVNKTYEWIRLITGFSEEWTGQGRDGTTIQVKDGAMYLQNIKPNPMFLQSMTVGEIVWRVLDSVGFTNYGYERIDADPVTLVPYWWTDGTKTVWELLSELAQQTQSALYFDEFGVLQIKTRTTAYNLSKTPVWSFIYNPSGSRLPDIISLDRKEDYEANVVNVAYKNTKITDDNNGVPIMETIWEPEGDVVLRASPLYATITANSTAVKINPVVANAWPFNGVMNIEGEFIRWESKGYSYYDASGNITSKYITSEDEREALDKLNPTLSFKNYYNGWLYVAQNRGIWNTAAKAHSVDSSGWTTRYRTGSGTIYTWSGGFIQQPAYSTVRMKTNSSFGWNSIYVASRGTAGSPYQTYVSTRMKYTEASAATPGAAGLVLSPGTNDSGYFVELFKTALLTPAWLGVTNELSFYTKKSDGTSKKFGPNGGKGVRLEVVPEKWYDIDVHIAQYTSTTQFDIAINGVRQMSVTLPSSEYITQGNNGRVGLFVRGNAEVEFEYIAGTTNNEYTLPDEPSIFDRITGGYQSNQLIDEIGYRTSEPERLSDTTDSTTIKDRYNALLWDEFGPVCHEVREYEVQFSKVPVLHSRLYFSNESQVICPEYNSDPFSARFILGNKYRNNAVVKGEDLVSFGSENPVNQQMLIYGRVVTQDDEKIHTVRNENAIRRRGEVTLDVTSDWIQSEAAAKALGDWITLHWSGGADEIEIESFGNPLLQIGDIASVNYPLLSMSDATHKYFIVKISHEYKTGLATTYTLRRAKI